MEITKELIRRYHLDQCTEAEKLAVEAWLASEDATMSYPEDFDLVNTQANGWEKISERYGLGQDHTAKLQVHSKKKNFLERFWLPAAACLAFVFTLGITYKLFNNDKQASVAPAYQTIRVKKGEKRYVALTDGTQVWLNSESSLTFPNEFTGIKRTVNFTGEAYFRVAKNPKKPFIISSPRTTTKVLGTRFNLRDYQNEGQSELVVEEGKVSFSGLKISGNLILTANQKGIIDVKNKLNLTQNIGHSAKYTDWKENKLVLDDLTLEEIKPILERWYNITIVISSKELNKERYKGSFNNPNIKEVLSSICFATRSAYSQQNKTFTIGK
ncbi:FecR family protein [Pedobacter nototheniae]|uniref:FecR family protein n=1 Tax=Pedobacter nototheniae TaxID=2488994 RepID=UPI002931276C|nr:FecR domain-containing protein [Pedobacter nototheniae]